MAIYSGLFNSVNGDRRYDAAWFALYFSTFIGNGVFPNPSTNLQVLENEDMTVTVKPGKGWINGYFLFSDTDHVLQHDLADGVLKRIDRIVMRLDYGEREIDIVIKKGNFASNPVAPGLQRDADAYELALADVLINNGATQITQANITDTRLNNELCGIMHTTVEHMDTTTLYNQYLDFWENWRTGKMDEFEQFLIKSQNEFDEQTAMNQQEFDQWLSTVQEILNENVAGNLLDLINANAEDIDDLMNFKNSKGQPGGYPELDQDGKVPMEQLPSMDYVPTSEKGLSGGVATLDSSGQVPESQLKNVLVYYETRTGYLPSASGVGDNGTFDEFRAYHVGDPSDEFVRVINTTIDYWARGTSTTSGYVRLSYQIGDGVEIFLPQIRVTSDTRVYRTLTLNIQTKDRITFRIYGYRTSGSSTVAGGIDQFNYDTYLYAKGAY